ncbi:MAG: VacJ family lipoprotein [Proteobacteria bacterium]|jgi:phospholipid-binding lipoprotein MlaA|nr:VacJ family lipoprotein [Pseudomonadota bacterium]
MFEVFYQIFLYLRTKIFCHFSTLFQKIFQQFASILSNFLILFQNNKMAKKIFSKNCHNLQKKIFIFFLAFFGLTQLSFATDIDKEEDLSELSFESNKPNIYDPYEKYNRQIYNFNEKIDIYFFEKIAQAYRFSVPKPARNSVNNFFTNLYSPISGFNSLAQGKTENALATFSSFFINSTFGCLGLFDVAKKKNISYQFEDLGQTLAYHGLKSSPYLVLPLLGPSTGVDFVGLTTEKLANPLGYDIFNTNSLASSPRITINSLNLISNREELLDTIKEIRKNSFDSYALVRTAYLQRRKNQINN